MLSCIPLWDGQLNPKYVQKGCRDVETQLAEAAIYCVRRIWASCVQRECVKVIWVTVHSKRSVGCMSGDIYEAGCVCMCVVGGV